MLYPEYTVNVTIPLTHNVNYIIYVCTIYWYILTVVYIIQQWQMNEWSFSSHTFISTELGPASERMHLSNVRRRISRYSAIATVNLRVSTVLDLRPVSDGINLFRVSPCNHDKKYYGRAGRQVWTWPRTASFVPCPYYSRRKDRPPWEGCFRQYLGCCT